MKNPARTRSKCLKAATCALSLALLAGAQPAVAQGWNYSPFTGGSTWLGVSRLLSYPLNRYSTPAAPFYLADPVVRYGTYYAGQAITGGSRRYNYGNYYSDSDTFNDPRQRTRPVVTDGNGVTDQVVHAKPFHQDFSAGSRSGFNNGAPPNGMPPGDDPYNLPPGAVPYPSARSAPPVGGANAPLAAGFIDVVNTKYHGDISKALFDPETRSYARSVGLIDSDEIFDADLKPQKVETIRGILGDTREDATVRINAVRMLLKH